MTIFKWSRIAGFALLSALILCLSFSPALAQQTLGSINGTVLDTSGAAVSGALVTVTDKQIDVTRSATAQANGFFQVFNLPIGTYDVKVTHDGFDTTELPTILVQEARATTVNVSMKVGSASTSIEVTGNPMLNATDATNGYTLDAGQIASAPLATGSFTQLATLSPGVNAELLSGLDSNAGLGNQPIWANGQRATSNTFQVNGVDVSNIFNGSSSSGEASQRYNFNIGGGSTSASSSAGSGTIAGANLTSISVYGSIGNALPSPPPEMTEELRVNTSMYDAQQGATSGAQIDVNTKTGTNEYHGQAYGMFANNSLNASPFFFNQAYQLSLQGVGAFPESLVVPALHRWTTGGTIGGPIWKDKLFFFLAYQHLNVSDASTSVSQFNVPTGLTDDRSATGLTAAANSFTSGFSGTIGPLATALLNAKLPNGQFLIPSAQSTAPYQYGVPNVTLLGTSYMIGDQANLAIDYNATARDRLELKLFYQNDPTQAPYAFSQVGGFPVTQNNAGDVISLDNTTQLSSRLNWEQRVGYSRMRGYEHYNQTVQNSGGDPNFGYGAASTLPLAAGLPGLLLKEFVAPISGTPGLKVGPYSSFANMGFTQNRLNPSSNLIWSLGKHTIVAGGGYSYTQLNIDNNRTGLAQIEAKNFDTFLEDQAQSANVLNSIDTTNSPNRNLADRYYRSNELAFYAQDKWQVLPNLSITAGVRYDYHGGLTEKYGNIFNFDPSLYDVTGDTTSGFTVTNAGFVVASNNKYYPTANTSDSTLSGRQWGISPRVGFAWAPKQNHGNVVFSGGAGIYYDRGELFSYLSQPAGSGNGGPFGVTEAAPLATYVSASSSNGISMSNPLGNTLSAANGYVSPNANPATIQTQLQTLLDKLVSKPGTPYTSKYGKYCGALDNQEGYTDCPDVLNFGAYDKSNKLPYTINYTFNVQWQPTPTVAMTLGYTGNLGRHAVIPFPLNEPGIATSSNPIHGETATYGFQVLNQNSFSGYDYNAIAGEPWNTEDGGNTDLRVPYVGYSPNAAIFKTAGNSAYNALQAHLEKRLSHHVQAGASYTFSHTLDEQSDIGLFFTGNNPNNLRSSYASSDFDRTHVFSANFQLLVPNAVGDHSPLAYLTNDWHLNGIGILQSGEPFSLYEFYGAVGSLYFGDYPTLLNPILPIKDPAHPKTALTGNSGKFRGAGGSFIPQIDPTQIAINYVAPGTNGVPVSTGSDPQDIYETDFAPSNQRNIFRQGSQRRLDLSLTKTFKATERFSFEYRFNVFNVTNTMSPDVAQDQTQVRQASACSNSAVTAYYKGNNCNPSEYYVNYGQIVTSSDPTDQQSAKANLDKVPYVNGTGKGITVPTTLPLGTTNSQGAVVCTSSYVVSTGPTTSGCPNNGANFGSVTSTIGSPRMVTMSLHITF